MVSAGGAATPHGLGSLNEMAPLPRNRPQGIGFSPCATLFRNPGKWMRNLQKSDRGGVYGIVERGSGVANSEVRQSHEWGEFREFRQDEEVLQEIIKRRFGEVLQVERGEVQEIIKHLRLTSLSFGFLRTPHFRSPLGRGRTSSHATTSVLRVPLADLRVMPS